MNPIQKLNDALERRFADGVFTLTAPLRTEEDTWTLDVVHGSRSLVVEWTPPDKFGVSLSATFGGGPDEMFATVDDALSAVVQHLSVDLVETVDVDATSLRDPLSLNQATRRPSLQRAVVVRGAKSGDGHVLWCRGDVIETEVEELSSHIGDLGLDDAPVGIHAWEGTYEWIPGGFECPSDGSLDPRGAFRPLTATELARVARGASPWVDEDRAAVDEETTTRVDPVAYAVAPQPPPANPPRGAPVWPRVIAELRARGGASPRLLDVMEARDRQGREKYGVPLCAGDGRDTRVDALQEALDLIVYLHKLREETNCDLSKDVAAVVALAEALL